MNKTLNINLGGLIFHIDEDAYYKLERYLTTLKRQFSSTEGGEEIIKDVEMRIAELFRERTSESKEVISVQDVDEVINIMGKPEDYLDPENETGKAPEPFEYYSTKRSRRIFRDPDDRILGGVASGLAAYFNIDPLWMRILFVLLVFSGFGILFYFILWLVIPKATTTVEKLQMRGESVNISNIEKSIREEMREVEKNVKSFTKKASEYDYRRPANQVTGFFRDLIDFILTALRLILKFILKLIGLAFIALGFIVLFALVVALFSGGINVMGNGYGFGEVYDFLRLVTVNSTHLNLLLIGIALLILAPLTLIIYLGVRIIFKLGKMGNPARTGLVTAAIIGFFMVLIAGIRIGADFNERSYYTTYQEIGNQFDQIYLRIDEDDIYRELQSESFALDWIQTPDGNAFTKVYLDIQKAEDSTARLRTQVESWGYTRRTARDNAQKVSYNYTLQDSLLYFDAYYLLKEDYRFRDQEVHITLYLPEGMSVYLDDNMVDIIYDIRNVNNYWDFDMANHWWQMTGEGLKCMDCPENRRETDETGDTNDAEHEDVRMKINGSGMKIEISMNEEPVSGMENFFIARQQKPQLI